MEIKFCDKTRSMVWFVLISSLQLAIPYGLLIARDMQTSTLICIMRLQVSGQLCVTIMTM